MFQIQKLSLLYSTIKELFDALVHTHDQTRRFLNPNDRGDRKVRGPGCICLVIDCIFYGTVGEQFNVIAADFVKKTPLVIANQRPATRNDLIYIAADIFSGTDALLISVFMARFASKRMDEFQVEKIISISGFAAAVNI